MNPICASIAAQAVAVLLASGAPMRIGDPVVSANGLEIPIEAPGAAPATGALRAENVDRRVDDTVLDIKLAPLRREIQALHGAIKTKDRSDDLSALRLQLDEASTLAAVLNGVARASRPLSFVTFGQRVPEDLARADAKTIAAQMVSGLLPLGAARAAPAFNPMAVPVLAEQAAGVAP